MVLKNIAANTPLCTFSSFGVIFSERVKLF